MTWIGGLGLGLGFTTGFGFGFSTVGFGFKTSGFGFAIGAGLGETCARLTDGGGVETN